MRGWFVALVAFGAVGALPAAVIVNSQFTNGLTGWTQYTGTATWLSSGGPDGSACVRLDASSQLLSTVFAVGAQVNGLGYDASFYCRWGSLGDWGTACATIDFLDASQNQLGSDWLLNNQQGDGYWTWFTKHFASLPPGTAKARIRLRHDSGGWYVDFDNVKFAATLPPVTVRGTVTFVGFTGDNSTAQVTFVLHPVSGGDNVTRVIIPNADGSFLLDNISQGTYSLTASSALCLTTALPNVSIAANPTLLAPITLRTGDSNGDNQISFEDFAMLQNHYGHSGAAAADPLAAAASVAVGCEGLGIVLLSLFGLAVLRLGPRTGYMVE